MLKRLDVTLLGLLHGRPRTGYDVRKWLDQYGRTVGYTAPPSQIYRQLARLVDRGWADVAPSPRTTGPDAKLYALTAAGHVAFEEWCRSPYVPSGRVASVDFQVRMTFTAHLGPATLLDLVRAELAFRREQHETPLPFDPSLVPEDADEATAEWVHQQHLLATERGRLLGSVVIVWLESTELRLQHLVEPSGSALPDPDLAEQADTDRTAGTREP